MTKYEVRKFSEWFGDFLFRIKKDVEKFHFAIYYLQKNSALLVKRTKYDTVATSATIISPGLFR